MPHDTGATTGDTRTHIWIEFIIAGLNRCRELNTSALAHSVCILAQELAQIGRFGRALPPSEQTFVVLTDSVLKQLDGLKGNPALASAVRAFLGRGLDSCGPAGVAATPSSFPFLCCCRCRVLVAARAQFGTTGRCCCRDCCCMFELVIRFTTVHPVGHRLRLLDSSGSARRRGCCGGSGCTSCRQLFSTHGRQGGWEFDAALHTMKQLNFAIAWIH